MLDWFLNGCIPSLLQPNNIPAAKEDIERYIIYTNGEALLKADPRFQHLQSLITIEIRPLPGGENNVTACTVNALEHCSEANSYACIISPDHIYGDGSIVYIVGLCKGERADMICYGFPRVKTSIVPMLHDKLKHGVITNRELVRIGMDNIHQETTTPGNGVNITKIDNNTWDVSHTVPTVVFKATKIVLDYMRGNTTKNSLYDHCLPYHCVRQGMTFFYINDSDNYFSVEPTDRQFALCHEGDRPGSFRDEGEANRNFWANLKQVWRAS